MQPTPRTSTSSLKPASLTACSRFFLTVSDLDDMQPAAMQQRMTVFLRVARSFSAIALRSSMTIGNPSFQVFDRGFRSLARRDRAVINDRRRDAAGADAPRGQQRKLVVRRRFASLDFRLLLDRGEHLVRAFDIAGRAEADDASVLALWFEGEEMVERRHAIDSAGGQFEPV